MCRLFGLMANREVNVEFSFLKADTTLKQLGSSNDSGWGIGYYSNKNAKMFKEPISTVKSEEFPKNAQNIKSKIIISHVRLATQGKESVENTHPFSYDKWIFAHNGNIGIKEKLKTSLNSKYKGLILGETDSEIYFYWILQNIDEGKNEINGIKKAVYFIEKNNDGSSTGLNFVLSNGKEVFALRKAFMNLSYYSLYYLQRDPKKSTLSSFESKETRMMMESKSLLHEKAVIICSERLTKDETWTPLDNNDLLIVDSQLGVKRIEVRE